MENEVVYKERIWWESGEVVMYTYYPEVTSFESLMQIYQRDITGRVDQIIIYKLINYNLIPIVIYDKSKQEEFNANKNY